MAAKLRLTLSLVSLLVLVVPNVGAQQVTGRVIDQRSGQPLAAVQVFIPGAGIGALSQQNGRYLLLNVPAGTQTLTAQRIGYRVVTVEITVAADGTVVRDFSMSEEALGLDEIIVTGTPGGTQRRAIGNSVTAVSASEITQAVAVGTVQELLAVRSPGVQFSRVSGNVGTGSGIEIRGVGSFNLGADPLIYVDGIRVSNNSKSGPRLGDQKEVNPLDDFNPQDIESIEIIKGPAAATLYGTEASAGVIQIITKRGAEGEAQFDMSVRGGVNFMRSPRERVGPKWACANSFNPPCSVETGLFQYWPYDEANLLIAEGAFPWPQKELFQYGPSQSYNLDVRGGTQTIRYFLSGNFDRDEGITFYNWDKTVRLRANVGVVFSEHFSLDVSTGFVDGETRFGSPAQGDGGEWEDMRWSTGFCLPRVNPGACPRLMGFQEHLPSDVAKLDVRRKYSKFTGSGTLNFTTGDWFSSRAIIGLDRGWERNTNLWPLETQLEPVYEETAVGTITLATPTTTNLSMDWSATARYSPIASFGTATSVGVQYYSSEYEQFENIGVGFPSPLSTTVNQTPPASADINYEFVQNKSLGFYVQEEFSWNDRLFVTGAIRFDDNSAFGSEFDLEKYPKVSATWVLSEENFWTIGMINSLRVRGAWGKAGRQPDTFAGTNQYGVIAGVGGNATLRPESPGNPKVGPETSTELELGFDAALFDDRVATEFTWYTQKNENALLAIGIPLSVGFPGATQQNLGRIDNWGWEASVRSRIVEAESFSFGMDFTASHVDNEIKDLGTFPGTNYNRRTNGAIKVGFPYPNYGDNFLIVDAKLDPNGPIKDGLGNRISATCDAGVKLGDGPQYGLVEGGAVIDCEDHRGAEDFLIGAAFYKYRFSVAPRFNFFDNALQLTVLADGAYGKHNSSSSSSYNNDYANRCQCDPKLMAEVRYRGFSRGPESNNRIYPADFWKLREVGVRYNLPESWVSRIGAGRGSVNFSGREVALLWLKQSDTKRAGGFQGLSIADPELQGGGSLGGNSNHRALPPLTSYHVTLRLSF